MRDPVALPATIKFRWSEAAAKQLLSLPRAQFSLTKVAGLISWQVRKL
jgi:hypothetical protein